MQTEEAYIDAIPASVGGPLGLKVGRGWLTDLRTANDRFWPKAVIQTMANSTPTSLGVSKGD